MELESIVKTVSAFHHWSHTEKIKFFGWFIHDNRNKTHFEAKDIAACFDLLSLAKPSSIHPLLVALTKKKPPELLKSNQGYRLESRVRTEFDKKYGQRESTVHVDKLLTELPNQVQLPGERGYLEEALICFRHGAFRAAIVMSWNLAFDHLCQFVLGDSSRLAAFNTQLPKTYPKAGFPSVGQRDDFTELKESQVIQVCRTANIINTNVNKILKEKLDRRNIAAHPSTTGTSQVTAEEFIRDLIENVVLKLT